MTAQSHDIKDIPAVGLDGSPISLTDFAGPLLVVNVASKCGLTPQYAKLEQLAQDYPALTVLGVPCNQFMGQEPGSPEEIATFCSVTYGVTFPLLEKAEVNGTDRSPLYVALTQAADAEGVAGDIQSNFEKFLVSRGGEVLARFRPSTEPDAPEVVAAIEAAL